MENSNHGSSQIQIGTWTFNILNLTDKFDYYQFIGETEYPAVLWSSNFAYLWASSQTRYRKIVWKKVDGLLVLFQYNMHQKLLIPMCLPLGKGDSNHITDALYKCMEFCYQYNKLNNNEQHTRVRMINDLQLQFLKSSSQFEQLFLPKKTLGLEIHYSIQKLLQLDGKEFEYVRRKLNKFHRKYPQAIIREYKLEDYNQLLLLNKNWEKQKNKSVGDHTYYREILKRPEDLDHIVLVVEMDGKIIGMTSGGCLPNGQTWTCLRKGDHTIEGLSEWLLTELAKVCYKINPSIEYMNDGSDMGDAGLCFFKERFRPVLKLKRYRIYYRVNL